MKEVPKYVVPTLVSLFKKTPYATFAREYPLKQAALEQIVEKEAEVFAAVSLHSREPNSNMFTDESFLGQKHWSCPTGAWTSKEMGHQTIDIDVHLALAPGNRQRRAPH